MKSIFKMVFAILSVGLILSATACNNNNQQKMTTQESNSIFPKGDKLPNNYFTGEAFLKPLVSKDKNNDFVVGNVSFEPGARTHWHTHPQGQVLIVIEGNGFYQEKGNPAQALKKGDVVNVAEDTEHWHGASANSSFAHIAITNFKGTENVVWLQPVTEQEYNDANKQ